MDGNEDGYSGAVVLSLLSLTGDAPVEITATATLRGYFEPVDGRYHWYGRVAANDVLTAAVGSGKASVVLTTPHGAATGTLGDIDPWGRLRVSGVSRPPFPVASTLDDLDQPAASALGG